MKQEKILETNQTVSIIIPIYNKEKYLEKCLDSILNQTYQNLEIILVDDGSTDGSLKICRRYAQKDLRFRVYTKENGGVSSARNLGIEKSTGSCLSFVDPDDFVHSEYVERLKDALDETGAEIAYCRMLDIWEGDACLDEKLSSETRVIDAQQYDWFDKASHTVACAALYKKSCIEGIRFDSELKIAEDTLFLARCIRQAKKIVRLEDALYYYYHNPESVTQCQYFPGKLTEMNAWQRIIELYADNPEVQATARAGYAHVCREMVVKYCKDSRFMQEGCPAAKAGFEHCAPEMLRQLWKKGQYKVWAKVLYSLLFWNAWLRKKQKA